ncbi:phosphoribosyltransferase family protein [Candidatus Avelusimicrobium faecicola]|uniref:phosphoribosyltransferase family protein n=1 Tax=Candidatus Avelusimicrobium faecicola TaxID=3416205 RepID=UPI0015A2B12F|nr:orotate phosphoribosyltransferase [Spirochaetota bacterium]MCI7536198.1 orotate phosphoribosyltransferase [Spirochaetota bacterium]MDY2939476.1 phosphoribosyltransferase family protein [Elusimicrobiaceae bacterium]
MPRNNLDVLCLLQEHGAIMEGHFVMPSGFHSQSYIQTSLLLQHPHLAQRIAQALSDKFSQKADVILALEPSNSVLAQEVARVRGARAIFASRNEQGQMVLKHNFVLKPGERVLVVDDVTVGGRKLAQAIELAQGLGAHVFGVAVIVDRSMGYLPLTIPLRALLSYPMETFTAKECPLCAAKIPFTDVETLNK